MAEEQFGARKEGAREWPGWTRLFGAFKVALDYKKLLLAAAGILVMAFGWWLLSVLAFNLVGGMPKWSEPDQFRSGNQTDKEAYANFKESRRWWNFTLRMAGPPGREPWMRPDVADVADTLDEYKSIDGYLNDFREKNKRLADKLQIERKAEDNKQVPKLVLPSGDSFTIKEATNLEALEKDAARGTLRMEDVSFEGEGPARKVLLKGNRVELSAGAVERLYEYTRAGKSIRQMEDEAKRIGADDPKAMANYLTALNLYRNELKPIQLALTKPHGELRTWPWFEGRGPNPYLLLTGNVRAVSESGEIQKLPWQPGHFLEWMLTSESPVLVEPLIKFLEPVLHLFNPAAGGWLNKIYLILIVLWTLAVWAVFGGAITRMAAVQLARKNEKVGLTEALRFAWQRKVSYFTAPLAPLAFLLVLLVLCILAGLAQWLLVWLADVLLVLLIIPGVLVLGLIMAVVLVGLVGWPLMYCTISTEGSDSFDAISRSYSYVFQAAWSYLWYAAVALVYGAALVFFVGLMGSLMVYLGKWGMSQTYAQSWGRSPAYLFAYAPTSFGWRDLLLQGSPDVESIDVLSRSGLIEKHYVFPEERMTWNFRVAAFFTAAWLYLVFLLVIGFGYSYFWTASSMIYLLMRRQVDDTDLEEIHLEEEEEEPFQPTPPAAPPAAKPTGPGNVTMLEAPTLRPAPKPPETAKPTNESPPAPTPPADSPAPAPTGGEPSPAPAPSSSSEEPKS
jgi:hypothetical protein